MKYLRPRKYFILWDIVNPQLGSWLGLGLGSGLGLDSVRRSTISHKMKYLPRRGRQPPSSELNVDNWKDNCEAKSKAKSPRPLRGLQVDFSLT